MMQVEELTNKLALSSLETEVDVQHAVSHAAACERAIIFIHVDWAPMATKLFAQFVLEYQDAHPNDGILFHYIDCTPITDGYHSLRSLAGWSELEKSAGTSLIHGWGELVWLQRGRVLHVERIVNFGSAWQLVEKTETLTPTKEGG